MHPTRKEIKESIWRFIAAGHVVLASKTKAAIYGGKHLVSVGRHQTATNKRHEYAVIYTGKSPLAHGINTHYGAYTAASEFVNFCGNEIAWNAYKEAKAKL